MNLRMSNFYSLSINPSNVKCDFFCFVLGKHVALHPSSGSSGDPRDSHGPGYVCTDGWHRSLQPSGRTDPGHQVEVE